MDATAARNRSPTGSRLVRRGSVRTALISDQPQTVTQLNLIAGEHLHLHVWSSGRRPPFHLVLSAQVSVGCHLSEPCRRRGILSRAPTYNRRLVASPHRHVSHSPISFPLADLNCGQERTTSVAGGTFDKNKKERRYVDNGCLAFRFVTTEPP